MNKFFNQLGSLVVRVVCGPDQAELQARREKELRIWADLEKVSPSQLIDSYRLFTKAMQPVFYGRQANPDLAVPHEVAVLASHANLHPELLDSPVQRLRQTLGIARAY